MAPRPAALLHDTIEDTETSYDELRGQFGARIADIVAEVTDTKFLSKQSRKRLQLSKAGRASAAAQQVNSGRGARRPSGRRSASASTSTGRRRWWIRSGRRTHDWRRGLMRCGRRGAQARGASAGPGAVGAQASEVCGGGEVGPAFQGNCTDCSRFAPIKARTLVRRWP